MDLLSAIKVAATGLRTQSGRMRIIAENLANADSTAKTPGGDPYRRRVPVVNSRFDDEIGAYMVRNARPKLDMRAFKVRYDPGHPAADEKGYVKTSNVNSLIETADLREAQRSYEANINVITSSRRMITRTLDILKA
ncbi:MAG: flagellar basal body rod protein FlgC [Hyphomicrobiales bacterium]|nr:MAG: flagellar basal body rod protein FlgC [Hyphomicrobiales bacterium]